MATTKASVCALLLLLPVFVVLPLGHAAEQQPWVKFSGNPVLMPTADAWDSEFVVQPAVLYDQVKYRMWYLGGREGVTGIGYAESDNGVTWTKHGPPVLSPGLRGTWDSTEVGLGCVIWDGTRFLMYYRGASPIFTGGAIGLATSSDGIVWVKYSGNPVLKPSSVDQKYMGSPEVLQTSALFNMWYSARSTDDPTTSQVQRLLYATSFDGLHWQKYTGVPKVALEPNSTAAVWDSGSVYSVSVYSDGTNHGMWYSALNQTFLEPKIGFATSKDLTLWTKFSGNPVLEPGLGGSWDSVGVENPSIVVGKLGFMLFYDGIGEMISGSIGFAQPPMGFEIPEFDMTTLGLFACVLMLVVISMVKPTLRRKSVSD